ncbi:hypothetical protein FHS43_006085 [Streptosporangium becharense]|uniref:DUF1707 domain-containing protein n=1 Tax=Streptosporangium becharense TaxID=1816182 RepID=A0A7W9MHQ5_9ACTN|nr:DUF1707 domain-containing protein [Streptosporangium becharense]MBB2914773.1 hypothetical protein [Streptosporangium becharense]MBB5820826.1 hypothetical protein [Streptosporangium becharense]
MSPQDSSPPASRHAASRVPALAPGSALRASDADRDRVAAVLGEALATGRLTSLEHADRLDATYAAVTVSDLVPITGDLPDVTATSAASPTDRQEVGALFSKVVRGGRWLAGRHTRLSATFGALIVDLSEAVLPGREITLEVGAHFGKLIIRVPEGAHVIDEVSGMFAKRHISGGQGGEGTPVIRVVGRAAFGKIVVSRERTDWNLPSNP